jgi:hypothetical protein
VVRLLRGLTMRAVVLGADRTNQRNLREFTAAWWPEITGAAHHMTS